ncbi:MAG: hypothetical protein WCG83_01365 [Candidatus Peregrinibacteria bacterium]
MMYRDDEEISAASTGSSEHFTRSDKGRRETLKREIESKKGRQVTDREVSGLKQLKTKMTLQDLKKKVNPALPPNPKSGKEEKDEAKKHETFGPKTIVQKTDAEKDARKKTMDDDRIQQQKERDEEKAQAQEEYQANAG